MTPPRMVASELLRVLGALSDAGCPVWLEGGWGVDALAGGVTRAHQDADIDFDAAQEGRVIDVLTSLGYAETLDQRPTRFEMRRQDGSCVDLHPLHFADDGSAVQLGLEGERWRFEAHWFTTGSIDGQSVPCYTVEAQLFFHEGYELRDVDRVDLDVLAGLTPES